MAPVGWAVPQCSPVRRETTIETLTLIGLQAFDASCFQPGSSECTGEPAPDNEEGQHTAKKTEAEEPRLRSEYAGEAGGQTRYHHAP